MAWADVNYLHKKQITIDHTKVQSNQVDFPIVITKTDADLTNCLANGYDIKFYDSTELIKLKHERVEWNNATGYFVIWIKIPSLSSLVDTVIYMYYEYPGEVVDQADPTNVWDSNFIWVYHCNDANTQLTDSTINGYDASENNNPLYRVPGKIGYACHANNTWRALNGNVWLQSNAAWLAYFKTCTALSVECWTACDRDTEGSKALLISIRYDGGDDCRFTYKPDNPNNTGFTSVIDDGPVSAIVGDETHTWAIDEWHHLFTTHTNAINQLNAYTDGSWVGADNTNFDYSGAAGHIGIATRWLINVNTAYDGKLEEIRFSDTVRDSGWVKTGYNNTDNPLTFSTFGAEENSTTPGFEFDFPVKGHSEKKYKYKVKETEYKKYSGIQKDRFKYKAKKQE